MRILFAIDHLGYGDRVWHGCTTYLTNVLPKLRAKGHSVALCCFRARHESANQLVQGGVEVSFLGLNRFDPRAVPRFLDVVRSYHPDVIHAHQRESSMLARLARLSRVRPAVVLHVHDMKPTSAPERLLNRVLPQPDVALCVCKTVTAVVRREYGVEPQRHRILLNAIDTAKIKMSGADAHARARLRREWAIPLDAPIVVSASRFGPEKRLTELVHMIPTILARVPSAHFVFAGEGPDKSEAMRAARELGVDPFVRFLGNRRDIADVISACDVTALLCLREACSYSIIESLVLGRPVVGYSVGGNPELVKHAQTGLLAAPHDDEGFVDSLIAVLADPALRQRLSAGAAAAADRFDIRHHISELEVIYKTISAGRGEHGSLRPRMSH